MYGKMIKGLLGYPKMCKSIKGSAIDVTTPESTYRELIISNSDQRLNPDQNAVYQMMEQASCYSNKKLNELYDICKNGNKDEWLKAKEDYVKVVKDIFSKWPL